MLRDLTETRELQRRELLLDDAAHDHLRLEGRGEHTLVLHTGHVQRLVDAGADEIMFLIQMGTVPQEACLQTIRNLGEKVIPHFRD